VLGWILVDQTQCEYLMDLKNSPPMPEAIPPWSSAVRLGRYAANGAMAPHQHDEPSLSIVVDGSYEEHIRGRTSTHGPGSLLFCPAFETHSQEFCRAGTLQILMTPTPTALDFLGQRLSLSQAPYSQSTAFADLGLRLISEMSQEDQFSSLVIHGLVLETVGQFCRGVDPGDHVALSWLREAKSYIETHFSENLSLEALAGVVQRHPVHLARAFRRAFGETIGDCIRNARLRQAARLLLTGRRPIAEIATLCGFCDQAHLARSFRRKYGTTPAAYRNSSL
jgi:AraC family transcriptional regulator